MESLPYVTFESFRHFPKNIIFACSDTYSAVFEKKSSEHGILTLNIVQNVTNPKWLYASNHPPERVYKDNVTRDTNISKYGLIAIYDYNSLKGIPEEIPQITNNKTTIAQFGTVSVSGSC